MVLFVYMSSEINMFKYIVCCGRFYAANNYSGRNISLCCYSKASIKHFISKMSSGPFRHFPPFLIRMHWREGLYSLSFSLIHCFACVWHLSTSSKHILSFCPSSFYLSLDALTLSFFYLTSRPMCFSLFCPHLGPLSWSWIQLLDTNRR